MSSDKDSTDAKESCSLWSDTFNEMLDDELDYGDPWSLRIKTSLTDTVSDQERRVGWKVHRYRISGKFKCTICKKTWTSARVTLLFHYRVWQERGTVYIRPFKQACKQHSNVFVLGCFSKDEVERALQRLFYKIRKNCYNAEEAVDKVLPGRVPVRSKPHEASLCEACITGKCCQEDE